MYIDTNLWVSFALLSSRLPFCWCSSLTLARGEKNYNINETINKLHRKTWPALAYMMIISIIFSFDLFLLMKLIEALFFSEGIRLCFPYPNVCKIERIKYTECNIIISFSEKKNIIVSHSIWNLKGVIAYCHLVKLELRDGIWVWKCFGGIWWFDSTVCGFCCNSLQCTKLTSEFLR